MIEFFVMGDPKTAGSKRSGIVLRKGSSGRKVPALDPQTGLPRTFTTDSTGEAGKTWRADVRAAAATAMEDRPPLVGPLTLSVTFYRARTKGHYGTGRNARFLKPSAPLFPTTIPDTTKMLRAVEDALKGIVWRDDAQIIAIYAGKCYAEDGRVGAKVSVREAESDWRYGLAAWQNAERPQLTIATEGS